MKQNCTAPENFDIWFCIIFDSYYQSFIYGKKAGCESLSPPNFDLFVIFPNVLTPQVLRSSANFATNPRLYFLWRISSAALLVVNGNFSKIWQSSKTLNVQDCKRRFQKWEILDL